MVVDYYSSLTYECLVFVIDYVNDLRNSLMLIYE